MKSVRREERESWSHSFFDRAVKIARNFVINGKNETHVNFI